MKVDILIKNGTVIDPAAGFQGKRDLAVVRGRMAASGGAEPAEAAQVVDAEGCFVTPGFIDHHGHFFYRGNRPWLGLPADRCLPTGVTAAVDGGSAGWVNFPAFCRDGITAGDVTMRAYLACTRYGVCNPPETYEPEDTDEEELADVFDRYRDVLLGLKIRISKECVSGVGPLENALRMAERLKTRLCVHVAGSAIPMAEVASMLRPGDIFLHMYHGNRETIVTPDGGIPREVLEARERGVLFDMSCGEANFTFATAERAIQAGFLPDIISSDITLHKFHRNPCVRSLPSVMSKMLSLGLTLPQVVAGVTAAPARIMGLEGEIGTLRKGARADIAIFSVEDIPSVQMDSDGEFRRIDRLISPRMTICGGEFVWSREDFGLLRVTE